MTVAEQLKALSRFLEVDMVKIRYNAENDSRRAAVELICWTSAADADELVGSGATLELALAGAFAKIAGRTKQAVDSTETELEVLRARKQELFAIQSRAHNEAKKGGAS